MPREKMIDYITIADKFARILENEIGDFPEGFFDSFRYTQTGNNLTHPLIWGILSRKLLEFPGIVNVGIDVRINLGGRVKFQPDLVGFDSNNQMIVFLDYESPNSSDARIPTKDVDAYLKWWKKTNIDVPYLIVTTLPNQCASDWELRYTSKGQCNEDFRGKRKEIQKNPCYFWYRYYASEFRKRQMNNIALVNIEGKLVRRKYP